MVQLRRASSFHTMSQHQSDAHIRSRRQSVTRRVSSLVVFPGESPPTDTAATEHYHCHKVRFYLGSSEQDVNTPRSPDIHTISISPERVSDTNELGTDLKEQTGKTNGCTPSEKRRFPKIFSFKQLFRKNERGKQRIEGDTNLSQHSDRTLGDIEGSQDRLLTLDKPCSGLPNREDKLCSVPTLSADATGIQGDQARYMTFDPADLLSIRSEEVTSGTNNSFLAPDDHHMLSRVLHVGHVIGKGLRRANSTKYRTSGVAHGKGRVGLGKNSTLSCYPHDHVYHHDDEDDGVDDDEEEFFPHSFADESCLRRGDSFMRRHFSHLYRHSNSRDGQGNGDSNHTKHGHYHNNYNHHHHHHHQSLREYVLEVLHVPHRLRRTRRGFSQQTLRHSLASVELGSWAARGSRRGSSLPQLCASLSPLHASSRTEILQTISSTIIQLFQRRPLKENELGVLQEHVRFLINSEAGGLVHEYYKDQLLRKGMIILREKIKNEEGLDLLEQLGETWNYFFREILPCLQAILYPLTAMLAKGESVRSLSLLAFRNIVVLKVGTREALDNVPKQSYPPSIHQMLLVLQGVQDNVFLSENQFLLEKLVARVVCPYLGQRGLYEGGPDPVIKVKLKPIPLNIPQVVVSENIRFTPKSRAQKLQQEASLSPAPSLSARRGAVHEMSGGVGGGSIKKLRPVLEHVYDSAGGSGARRHSVVT